MNDEYTKPIPNLADPDMKPFWTATREHRLTAQRCTNCRTFRFPALPICDTCLDEGVEWIDIDPYGTVWSYVVYHRAFHPGFADEVPYTVAIVETSQGPRYTGRVLAPAGSITVGTEVTATFEDATADFTMVHWVPTS